MVGLIVFQVFSVGLVQAQKQVKIGSQVWMTRNLNVEVFRNGDPIPEATSPEEWKRADSMGQPVWCYYDFNRRKYGKLYNWYAVTDPRGLAPAGWHIPSHVEWDSLIDYLGGKNEEVAHNRLKSSTGWSQLHIGMRRCGFKAKPGGIFNSTVFYGRHRVGFWWSTSTTKFDSDGKMKAWVIRLDRNFNVLNSRNGRWFRETIWEFMGLWYGMSVRCVKD